LEDLVVDGRIIPDYIYLRAIGREGVDWIHLGQDREQNGRGDSCEHDNEPAGSKKGRGIF